MPLTAPPWEKLLIFVDRSLIPGDDSLIFCTIQPSSRGLSGGEKGPSYLSFHFILKKKIGLWYGTLPMLNCPAFLKAWYMYLFLTKKPILDPPSYSTHRSSFEAKVSLIRPEEPSSSHLWTFSTHVAASILHEVFLGNGLPYN